MANRIFDLTETKGTFQCAGIINGVAKDKFYTEKKTSTKKDWRSVNFGCEYDDKQTIYIDLNGMPQTNVYFSKRNQATDKTETKSVPWGNRHSFNEDGWRLIGVNLGLTKVINSDGKAVNDKKIMTPFDACAYIRDNLKDETSTFIRGNIEFSSFTDKDGSKRRGIKYIPNQISLCKDIDFTEYDYIDKKPTHAFTQTIIFMGINKELENDKDTGRFIVSAKIITYSDIVDAEFIIVNKDLANLFKKNLKPYNAIEVYGNIDSVRKVKEVASANDVWGEENTMNSVSAPFKTEMVITGATPTTIDKETYTEKNIAEAMAKIRNAQAAEQNFSGTTTDSGWGDDGFGDEVDFDEEW